MSTPILVFDLDDTLIRTSRFYYNKREEAFAALRGLGLDTSAAFQTLEEIEKRNVKTHGFAKERFPLSLAELYTTLAEQQALRFDYHQRHKFEGIGWSVYAQAHPLVEHVEEVLSGLQKNHTLYMFTKGDLEIQSRKVEQLDLARFFERVVITPDKTVETFRELIDELKLNPSQTYMIGDSIRSDINPSLRVGMSAIYIPSPDAWAYEVEALDPGYVQLSSLSELPQYLQRYEGSTHHEKNHLHII